MIHNEEICCPSPPSSCYWASKSRRLLPSLSVVSLITVCYHSSSENFEVYGITFCFFSGAVADNKTDLGPALTKAWQECVIPQVTTTVADNVLLYVPAGNYLLAWVLKIMRETLPDEDWNDLLLIRSTVTFDDAANWNLHIAGSIYLPFNPDLTGTMLTFEVNIGF